jgi:hypothetical protein
MKFLAIAIKHLIEHGADHLAIQRFVDEMAQEGGGELPLTPRQGNDYEAMFPSKEARRAFEYRQRKRDASVTRRDESVTNVTASPSPSSPYDNKNSSTPSNPILTPLPLKKESRARRLPEDWQPSEGLLSSKPIQKLGLPREVLSFETEAFRDHFLGNGRRMIDWNRTWSNWMREAVRRRSRAGGGPRKSETAEGFNRAFSRIRAHAATVSDPQPTNVVDLSEVRRGGEGVSDPPCDVEPSNGCG